jgi:hypothetical protein
MAAATRRWRPHDGGPTFADTVAALERVDALGLGRDRAFYVRRLKWPASVIAVSRACAQMMSAL